MSFGELSDARFKATKENGAILRERDSFAGAFDELRIHQVFKSANGVADGGLGHTKLLGSFGEAFSFSHSDE